MYNIEMYRDSKGWEPVTEFLLKQKEQNPAIFEKIFTNVISCINSKVRM